MTDTTCAKCGAVYERNCPKGDLCGLRPDPMSDATGEAVARAFCNRMGMDPDEQRDGFRLWHYERPRAREAIAMRLAVREVLG